LPKRCYGVIAQYPLCRGKDMAAADARILRVARMAVPRIGHVDSSMGPFCARGHVGPCPKPMRDLEIDTISLRKGLTHAETQRLVRAFRRAGIRHKVKPDACDIADKPR